MSGGTEVNHVHMNISGIPGSCARFTGLKSDSNPGFKLQSPGCLELCVSRTEVN